MKRVPGAVFMIDPHRERIAVTEANKLEVPVVATVDTNVDPDEIDHIIPANDDAIRAIRYSASSSRTPASRASRSARRARIEPEPEVAVAAEPEFDESAADELVAALAGGAALTFEPDAGRGRGLCPRPSASPTAGARDGRGDPRRDRRRARPRSGRKGRAGHGRHRGTATDTSPPSRAAPARATQEKHNEMAESLQPRSRSCASHRRRLHGLQERPRRGRGRHRKAVALLRERGLAAAAKKLVAKQRGPRRRAHPHGRQGRVLIEATARRTSSPHRPVPEARPATAVQVAGAGSRSTSTLTRSSRPTSRRKKAEAADDQSVQKKPEHPPKIVEGELKKWYAEVRLSTSRSATRTEPSAS